MLLISCRCLPEEPPHQALFQNILVYPAFHEFLQLWMQTIEKVLRN